MVRTGRAFAPPGPAGLSKAGGEAGVVGHVEGFGVYRVPRMKGLNPRFDSRRVCLAISSRCLGLTSVRGLSPGKTNIEFKPDLHFMRNIPQRVVEYLLRAGPRKDSGTPGFPLGHVAMTYAELLGELPHTQAHGLAQGACLPTGPALDRRDH
jgi:hypothetical protein